MLILRCVFIVFGTHVSLCKLSGIPFRREPCSHIAGERVRSSAWMQRRGIRIAVQIIVFYTGKTSICAIVSCSKMFLITKHTRIIVFRAANPSFLKICFGCRVQEKQFPAQPVGRLPASVLGRHRVTTKLRFLQETDIWPGGWEKL